MAENTVSYIVCLLYTSDAADEEDSVDLGGRRIIKKNNKWAIQGSNQGHPACKAGALPLS